MQYVYFKSLLNDDLWCLKVFEKENDAKMKRTMLRPLPSGRITISHAATWASFMGLAGTAILASEVTKNGTFFRYHLTENT